MEIFLLILITCLHIFNFEMISQEVINNLKHTNSSSFDNVPNKTVKDIKQVLTAPLYQASIIGILPDNMKIAKGKTFYEKDDAHLFNKYQPVYLLLLSRVFEKVLHKQIINYFINKNLLTVRQ